MNLVDRISDFIEKQEKTYLRPGEKAPKGTQEQRGKRGGRYYIPGKSIKSEEVDRDLNVEKIVKTNFKKYLNESVKSIWNDLKDWTVQYIDVNTYPQFRQMLYENMLNRFEEKHSHDVSGRHSDYFEDAFDELWDKYIPNIKNTYLKFKEKAKKFKSRDY